MKRHPLSYPLLITAAGLAVYANSFHCPLIFDDFVHIVQDKRLEDVRQLLIHSSRPVVALSLALNHRLGGIDVRGYHAVNLAIHLLAGLVLFGIVRRSLESGALRAAYTGRAAGVAATIALLWVIHPLQTQSVTYIIQRAEALMGLFYLLTLYALIRSDGSPKPAGWWLAGILSCMLGMGSKAVMATAPPVVLLYDRVFLAGSWREARRKRGLFYLGLFSTWGVLFLLFGGKADVYGPEVGFGIKKIPPAAYALTQPGVILHYLRLSLWPHPLVLDYGWPLARTAREVLPPLAAVAGLLALILWALRRRPVAAAEGVRTRRFGAPAGFLGAWFFLILAPTSSFIPILDPAFEYRMYLPLAAVIAGAVLGADGVLRRLFAGREARCRRAALCAAILTAGALGTATLRRNYDYRSVLSIWEDTVRKRPLNSRAHSNHGAALHLEGRVDEAIAEYREAVRLEPDYANGHNNLAYALEGKGLHEEAEKEFEEALRVAPEHVKAKKGLAMLLRHGGLILQKEGKEKEALARYRRALELDPEDSTTNNNIGTLAFQEMRWKEAEGWFRKALRIDPRNVEALNNLGAAMEMQGHLEEAVSHYRRALEIKPDYASAAANLERVRGRMEAARQGGAGP